MAQFDKTFPTLDCSACILTPRMVEAAKARLQELGLMSALDRRRLDTRDLTAANALFVYRPTTSGKDAKEESSTSDDVMPRCSQRAASPTDSSTWVRSIRFVTGPWP